MFGYKYIKKKNVKIVTIACGILFFLMILVPFVWIRIDSFRVAFAASQSHVYGQTEDTAAKRWFSLLTDEIYRSIAQNVIISEESESGRLKNRIEIWLSTSFESIGFDHFYNENADRSFRVFVVREHSVNPGETELSELLIRVDCSLAELGLKPLDGQWGVRVDIAAKDGLTLVHDFKGDDDIEMLDNSVFRRLSAARKYAVAEYDMLSETTLIDPSSIDTAIARSIPHTYDASVEQSAVYLETLLFDGWTIDRAEAGVYYLDYYLSKNGNEARLIVLEGSLKVFYWGTHK